MGQVLRFLKWAARSERRNKKPGQGTLGVTPYHRRLVCEPLETRRLLSASLPGVQAGSAAQQQTLADLPVAAQQAISSAIGQDQSAYHATSAASGVTLANPANGFTAREQTGALQVSTGSDTWDMTLTGLGYGGAVQPVGSAQTLVNGNRVDNNYASIDEWYVNGPSGLEQGFTIPSLPQSAAAGGSLTVELVLGGDLVGTVNVAGSGLTLTRPDGSAALSYTGLTACDGTGKILPASLELQTGSAGVSPALSIHVNIAGAQGAITIDPFVQEAKLTPSDGTAGNDFGESVAISGNTVVVGAPYATVGANPDQGAAYVFTESGSGWASMTQTAKLTPSDGINGDYFGSSVSICGNTVVVGAPDATVGTNTSQGAAYVFVEPGSGWVDMTQTAKLTASDSAFDDWFGGSVSISGNTVVVGADEAAYVFTEPVSGWASMTQTVKLTASDGAANDGFGDAVAISGNTLVVGADNATVSAGGDQGAAYVFAEHGSAWTQTAELAPSDAAAGDYIDWFGFSVSISGNTVVCGATGANSGLGAAYVFTEPASGWANMTQTAKLAASDDTTGDDFCGSVSISGNMIVVGAQYAAVDYVNQGATYEFTEPASGWASMTQTAKVTASDATYYDYFGDAVAISDNTVVVGQDADTVLSNQDNQAAYIFTTLPSVAAVSSQGTGAYGAGTTIPITVAFNEPVTVTGTPQLALNAGSGATANYLSGSGTSTLTFCYTVAAGQTTSDLDYTSTAALALNGGTIEAAGSAATLTLPATGTDGLAAKDIAVVPLSDGFESGNFSTWPWQLSDVGTSSDWTVESTTKHSGSYAAQSGAIGPASSSTLSLTLTVPAGELSFWRRVSSTIGGGSLIFEIDGVPQLQLSGTTLLWQQSFFWVSAGQHTFSWLYGKNAGDPAGNDFAYLDDVQFTPGKTLTVDDSSTNDQFKFDASGAAVSVSLNGEIHSFAAGEFSQYVFDGVGGTATLTGSASGNSLSLDTNGSGQLTNSTAGYTVSVQGMASIIATGHAGDTAQFFDSAGNDTFYAYADYDNSGKQLAGMYGNAYGREYSNSASGFGTNIGNSTAGSSDMAGFFDSPGNDTFYSYTDYNNSGQQLAGMYGSYGGGYSNTAKGFATNVGFSSNGGSDEAAFFDSLGKATFYAYADYDNSGQTLAGMLSTVPGGGYSNSARGFGTNVANSTAGSSDTAEFFDSPGNDTFYAYANYNKSGQTLAGMYGSYGSGYSNSASGFGTMVGNASNGGSDTATLVGSSGNDSLYTDAAIASLYGNDGSYTEQAMGFPVVTAIGGSGDNTQTKGPDALKYQLEMIGAWGGGS